MDEFEDLLSDVGAEEGDESVCEGVELRDLRLQKSKSLIRNTQSAIGTFNGFLLHMNKLYPREHPYGGYDTSIIPYSYFTKTLIGLFGNYVVSMTDLSFGTFESYLSRLKCKINEDYGVVL